MDEQTKESREARINRLLYNDIGAIDTICDHISNGGSVLTLCSMWNIGYADFVRWLNADQDRVKKYMAAGEIQKEWAINRLLQEIRSISFIDIRKIFNDDHTLRPPSEWPDDIAAAISSIEVDEIEQWDGEKKEKIGEMKKIKIFDKLKALEMLGKDLGRFINKHEISGKMTLEDLVTGSKQKEN